MDEGVRKIESEALFSLYMVTIHQCAHVCIDFLVRAISSNSSSAKMDMHIKNNADESEFAGRLWSPKVSLGKSALNACQAALKVAVFDHTVTTIKG